MKVAISFFYDLNKYFKYIKYLLIIFLSIMIISMVGVVLLKLSFIKDNMFSFSTNWVEGMNFSMDIKKIKDMYGIFNEGSYNLKLDDKGDSKKGSLEDVKDLGFDSSVVDTTEVVSKRDNANITITNADNVQKIRVYDLDILNYSSNTNIDIMSLFSKKITLTKKSDPVFVYTTHTSESYTNSEKFKFDYTSLYRTTDAKYNMLTIANEFSKALKEKDFNAIFDTTPHDYGTYEISYTNSRKTLTSAINNNSRLGLAIDMHRDAMADLTNGPKTDVRGNNVAKIMFVMGIGSDTYPNEYWQDNLALALQLQKLGEEMYPGIFRPMIVRNSKYNQDLVKYSFLIEIGTTGNTIEEAYLGARCLVNILNKFYNN